MLPTVIDTVRGVDVDGMTRPQLEAFVEWCRSVSGALAERKLAALAAIDSLGDGGLPSSSVERSRGRSSQHASARAAKTAATLGQMPSVKAKLARGELTEAHAHAVAAAAERVDDPAKADAALAGLSNVPADLFARRATDWADDNESQAKVERRAARQRRNRKAVFGTSKEDGSWSLYAKGETSEGRELRGLIDAEADRLFRDDGGRENPRRERTDDQRRFDALANLLRRGAGVGSSASSGRPNPKYQGVVTIPIDAYLDPATATAELIGSGPLPRAMVQRIMCDADLLPLIVDHDGQPLWAGRSARTANATQWKALVARDRGCVVCGADASRCEAHHIVWWEQNGPTDITNLVLLCTRHHHELHDHDLELARHDELWALRPKARPRPAPHPAVHPNRARPRSRDANRRRQRQRQS